jgi:hypothetical protein
LTPPSTGSATTDAPPVTHGSTYASCGTPPGIAPTAARLTGETDYTYVLAITTLDPHGLADTSIWTEHPVVGVNLDGLNVRVLQFKDMWEALVTDVTTRVEPSHVGRLAQMLRASGALGH